MRIQVFQQSELIAEIDRDDFEEEPGRWHYTEVRTGISPYPEKVPGNKEPDKVRLGLPLASSKKFNKNDLYIEVIVNNRHIRVEVCKIDPNLKEGKIF